MNKNELLAQARKDIPEITVEETRKLFDTKAPVRLIDVREQSEYEEGYVPGATYIPRGFLELRIEDKVGKDEDVIIYCAGGTRSLLAGQTLVSLNEFEKAQRHADAAMRLNPRLPGVYTLGGAQVALKAQGCAIGERVVFAGTGPLLYLVAYQYAKAGANVVAVLDTNTFVRQALATPRMLNQPATLAKGLYYVGALRARGVRVEHGVTLEGIDGGEGIDLRRVLDSTVDDVLVEGDSVVLTKKVLAAGGGDG